MVKASLGPVQTTPNHAAINSQVLSEAAHWFALLADESAPAHTKQQWQTWLDASENHRRAWQQVEAIGIHFRSSLPAPSPERQHVGRMLEHVDQQRLSRRRAIVTLGLACSAGLGSWLAVTERPWALFRSASHRTSTGQRQAFTLSDGTQLWLNSASAAQLAFSEHERVIELLEGEIWLQSGADNSTSAQRDLLVSTPLARLRALGTQFSVWLDGDVVDLSVYEGAVRIEPHGAGVPAVTMQTVNAGERLRFSRLGAEAKQAAAPERQAWRNGSLLAQNIRLDAFLKELSRYRRGRIDCSDEVASLHLIGVYQLGDTDAVLNSLSQALPVQVSRITPWWVRVGAR